MPLITIDMLEGRTVEQKRELVESLTQLVSEKIARRIVERITEPW